MPAWNGNASTVTAERRQGPADGALWTLAELRYALLQATSCYQHRCCYFSSARLTAPAIAS